MTEPIADPSFPTGTPAGGISRRLFLAGLPLVLAGCQSSPNPAPPGATVALADGRSSVSMYAAIAGEPFPVPAVNLTGIDPTYYRRTVMLPASIRAEPDTIVVDPGNRFLYLVRDDGRSAIRYGIGVGREGFAWNGDATIKAKREWPKWFPPKEMIARDPRAAPWANGMPGGPDNPLGARALYLYEGNVDTLYRIHGTNEPRSIGRAVSSGCIRMLNQDVIDLFERVPLGTKVIVLPA